jgi:undecaprenyl-diphosphatase
MFTAFPPGVPLLHNRLRQVAAVFAVLLGIGLGMMLAFGDADIVTHVHFSTWVQRHYAGLRIFTTYGLYVFYALFVAVLAWGALRREAGLRLLAYGYIIAQLLGAALIVRILKIVLGRTRPDATPLPGFESQWIGFTWESGYHSFPSGHTADIVTSVMFAALLIRNRLLVALCFAWALALGLSRLALAKHYPSDALVGALIAVLTSWAVVRWWLIPRLERVSVPSGPRWWFGPPR